MRKMRVICLSVFSVLAGLVWAQEGAPAATNAPTAEQIQQTQDQEDKQRYNQDLDDFEKNMNKDKTANDAQAKAPAKPFDSKKAMAAADGPKKKKSKKGKSSSKPCQDHTTSFLLRPSVCNERHNAAADNTRERRPTEPAPREACAADDPANEESWWERQRNATNEREAVASVWR